MADRAEEFRAITAEAAALGIQIEALRVKALAMLVVRVYHIRGKRVLIRSCRTVISGMGGKAVFFFCGPVLKI